MFVHIPYVGNIYPFLAQIHISLNWYGITHTYRHTQRRHYHSQHTHLHLSIIIYYYRLGPIVLIKTYNVWPCHTILNFGVSFSEEGRRKIKRIVKQRQTFSIYYKYRLRINNINTSVDCGFDLSYDRIE